MRTLWKVLGAAFVAIQGVRPSVPRPGVRADIEVPDDVRQVLKRSCYDCHSNETRIPWFDQVVPACWLVVADIRQARAVLDFSEVGHLPPARQRAIVFDAVNQVANGAMPPRRYTLVHPGAVVSAGDLAVLKAYLLQPPSVAPPAPPPPQPAASAPAGPVRPAPNGIAFDGSWIDWATISLTDRFDNGTFRTVLANDVAARAVAEKHTGRWPDGSMMAKVAWAAVTDSANVTRPGTFRQVEIMIRDEHRFASTEGWGYARWLGDDLAPYGASPDFASECVGCHEQMASHDHVFTVPVAMPSGAGLRPPTGALIDRRAGTIEAVFAGPGGAHAVTWQLADDPHWFGGRIPGPLQSTREAPGDAAIAAAFVLPRALAR